MNKKNITLFLSLLITSTAALYLFQYERNKKQKLVLSIKRNLISNNKRKSLSWRSFKKPKIKEKTTLTKLQTQKKGLEDRNKERDNNDFTNLQEKETSELTQFIESTLKPRLHLDISDIDKGIKVIDELISRNPNVYSSYKAKLLLLLRKENTQGGEFHDESIDELLETMSSFDIRSEYALRKESFLIAKTNNSLNRLDNQIEMLERELIRSIDQEERDLLRGLIATKLNKMEEEENRLENRLLIQEDYLNEDLVEIPLYRALVKRDYQNVIEVSNALIQNFPNTISGYFFLVKALELSGQKEESAIIIEQSLLDVEDLRELHLRLLRSKDINPEDFWKQLRF